MGSLRMSFFFLTNWSCCFPPLFIAFLQSDTHFYSNKSSSITNDITAIILSYFLSFLSVLLGAPQTSLKLHYFSSFPSIHFFFEIMCTDSSPSKITVTSLITPALSLNSSDLHLPLLVAGFHCLICAHSFVVSWVFLDRKGKRESIHPFVLRGKILSQLAYGLWQRPLAFNSTNCRKLRLKFSPFLSFFTFTRKKNCSSNHFCIFYSF